MIKTSKAKALVLASLLSASFVGATQISANADTLTPIMLHVTGPSNHYGSLSISADTTTTSANANSNSTNSATLKLGEVRVTDTRNSNSGWVASVKATDLVNGNDAVDASNITYQAGQLWGTSIQGGAGGVSAAPDASLSNSVWTPAVIAGRNAENGTTCWNPTVTIILKAGMSPGDYAGMIFHSIA